MDKPVDELMLNAAGRAFVAKHKTLCQKAPWGSDRGGGVATSDRVTAQTTLDIRKTVPSTSLLLHATPRASPAW